MAEYDDIEAYNYQVQQSNARTTSDDEYAAALREERVRTLLTEIDPSNQIESIIQRIRGNRYNKSVDMWESRPDAPKISDNFISKVEYILAEELSLNTTFSNLQPRDVNSIMALLIDVLVSDVIVHGREYYVTLKGQTTYLADDHNLKEIILYGIFSSVYKALRRSIGGTEARRFFGSLRMNETISPPTQKKTGIIEAVKSLYS